MITQLLNEVNKKIETLNNLVQDKEYFEKLDERIEKVNNYVQKQKQEIERLNNIINELEKWLEEQHQFIIEIPAYTKEISIEHKTMEICYENLLDKLQELKGSDKE